MPLLDLIEAARSGNEKKVHERAEIFTKHAEKLVEVANLVCSMSNNEDGVKMVRYAAAQIETLCPQVINAALILAARPNSKVAQENMDSYRQAWENQVRILTEAVDDITTIDDFLAVSENHILEDVNKCVLALQEGDAMDLRNTAGAIQGRSARVCHVVEAEMDNYEPCVYTKRVLEAVKVLRDQVMSKFAQRVDVAVNALSSNTAKDVDENDFIDASRLVYDGVREIRRAVLMNRVSILNPSGQVVNCGRGKGKKLLNFNFNAMPLFKLRRTKRISIRKTSKTNSTRWKRGASVSKASSC